MTNLDFIALSYAGVVAVALLFVVHERTTMTIRKAVVMASGMLLIFTLILLVLAVPSPAHFIGADNAERALRDNNIGGWCGRGGSWYCHDGSEKADCFERVGYHSYICNVNYYEARYWGGGNWCFGTLYAMHYGEVTTWTWGPGGGSGCSR